MSRTLKLAIRELNIAEENTLAFRCAVIILWALQNRTWNTKRISIATGYDIKDVYTVTGNLRMNGILKDDDWMIDLEGDDILSFTLVVLVASGEIVRMEIA